MKHTFHFFFASTLLLGLFIVLHVPDSDRVTQVPEHPALAHVELQAAICPNLGSVNSVSLISYSSEAACKSIPGHLSQLEYMNRVAFTVRNKIQELLYLELKPGIVIRCGQMLHFPSRFEAPPLS